MSRDRQSVGVSRSLVPTSPYQVTYGQQPGGAGWFGPLAPMTPIAPPDVKGRILDYQSGYNLNTQPRFGENVSFQMLRNFADNYDLLRLLIETRKDQMARMLWNVVPRDKSMTKKGAKIPDDVKARIQKIEEFFLMPDRRSFWSEWLSTILEDLFVIDAPSIYRRRTYGGELYALQPIDGATIKRVIDEFGNYPEPPNVAYQQVLKGYPAVDYTEEDLIYRPRVRRTHKVYGFSPVEQILMTINIGMRRQMWQLQSFTEGNIPEALIGTPSSWTPDQIRQFQDWFDSLLQGNSGERRKARFVPGELAKGYVATKPAEIFGEGEEWLIRVMCFAFSVSPQPFVQQVNRATAETAQETAVSDGLVPIQNWVKGTMDMVLIQDFASPDLEFKWLEEDELDPNIKSQIVDREQAAGRLTYNEARQEQGLDPYDHPDADRPMFKAATGWTPIFLTPEEQAQKDAAAAAISGAAPGDGEGGDDDGPPKPPGDGAKPPVPPSDGGEVVAKADWDEDAHPRDEHGRFGSGGGSSGEWEKKDYAELKQQAMSGPTFKTDEDTGKTLTRNDLMSHYYDRANYQTEHEKIAETVTNGSLSEKQVESIRDYVGGHDDQSKDEKYGSFYINEQLRAGEVSEKWEETVHNLDDAIASSKVTGDMVVYRSLGGAVDLKKVGTEFTDKAFASTSANPGVAAGYGKTSQSLLMRVNLKEGQSALQVHPGLDRNGFGNQREVVLPRDTTYRVVGKPEKVGRYKVVDVEIVS